jgi:hypothetical protein
VTDGLIPESVRYDYTLTPLEDRFTMRLLPIIALTAAGFALACGEDGKSHLTEVNQLLDSTSATTLTVTVLGLTTDSTLKQVGGAEVRFIRVGDIPPDSIPDSFPPPPPPPDSIPIDSAFGSVIYLLSDSIPGDTTQPPPPPPPPSTCGQIGRAITRGLTNRDGVLVVRGLPRGRYDILVEPPRGSRFLKGALCGLKVLPGQSAQVLVTLGPQ